MDVRIFEFNVEYMDEYGCIWMNMDVRIFEFHVEYIREFEDVYIHAN